MMINKKEVHKQLDQLLELCKIDRIEEIKFISLLFKHFDEKKWFFEGIYSISIDETIGFSPNHFFNDEVSKMIYHKMTEYYVNDQVFTTLNMSEFIDIFIPIISHEKKEILTILNEQMNQQNDFDFLFRKLLFRNERILGLNYFIHYLSTVKLTDQFAINSIPSLMFNEACNFSVPIIESIYIKEILEIETNFQFLRTQEFDLKLISINNENDFSITCDDIFEFLIQDPSLNTVLLSSKTRSNAIKSLISNLTQKLNNVQFEQEDYYHFEVCICNNFKSRSFFEFFLMKKKMMNDLNIVIIDNIDLLEFRYDELERPEDIYCVLQNIAKFCKIKILLFDKK